MHIVPLLFPAAQVSLKAISIMKKSFESIGGYCAPEIETLYIQPYGCLCQSPGIGGSEGTEEEDWDIL